MNDGIAQSLLLAMPSATRSRGRANLPREHGTSSVDGMDKIGEGYLDARSKVDLSRRERLEGVDARLERPVDVVEAVDQHRRPAVEPCSGQLHAVGQRAPVARVRREDVLQ